MNFGHKILLVFIVFGGLMGTLVYMSLNTEFELVSKDYYKDELAYQEVIDASRNANSLASRLSLAQNDKQVVLQLPEEMTGKTVSGEVHFYCPSDASKDRKIALETDTQGKQVFEVGKAVVPAGYKVRVKWVEGDKTYYNEAYMKIQ